MSMQQHKLQGIYTLEGWKKRLLLTKNIISGQQVYGEEIIKERNEEFRVWDPSKSKLCAALMKGVSQIGIKPGSIVLYLGAASGTTVSHVSDLVGKEGFVFAVEFAPRVLRELVFVAEKRNNIAPILADANQPQQYYYQVLPVDAIYQDIAQRNQVEIFLKNVYLFLKHGGFALLAVKARSINVAEKPKRIFSQVRQELEKYLTIVDHRELEPFQKDHCLFVCKKR